MKMARRISKIFFMDDKPLDSSLVRRKTFDSPLANHFLSVM